MNYQSKKNDKDKRLRVLVSAYACEPNKGSEPGVGWNWVKQIAKFAEAWVITRSNNKAVIEKELKNNPEPNLHFIYTDLPVWLRFWKKGQRGVHLYYYLWQFAIYFRAKRLIKEIKFDIAHHITFVNDWIFSALSFVGLPFIWGPIGSNKALPKGYLMNYKYYIKDRVNYNLRRLTRFFDPFYNITFNKAKRAILITKEQLQLTPFSGNTVNKYIIMHANAIDINDFQNGHKNGGMQITIFSAGSLIPIKGFHLAISAYAILYGKKNGTKYVISGDGPLKKYLSDLAYNLNIVSDIMFTGNILRREIIDYMRTSSIFLFPSFEGGGMVVLEAMASSLPVVCLDYGGPGEMVTEECGIKVKPITLEQTINDLANALLKLAHDPKLRKRMGEAGRRRVMEHYNWEKKGDFIKKVYEEVLNER